MRLVPEAAELDGAAVLRFSFPCSIDAVAADLFGGAEANALGPLDAEVAAEGAARVRVRVAGALGAAVLGVARADLAEVAAPALDLAVGAEEVVDGGAEGAVEGVERRVPDVARVARLGTPWGSDDDVAGSLRCCVEDGTLLAREIAVVDAGPSLALTGVASLVDD